MIEARQKVEDKEAEAERKAEIKRAKKLGKPIPPVIVSTNAPVMDTNSFMAPTP